MTITDATFRQDVLLHPGKVLVYFTSPSCSPCKALWPIVEELCAARGVPVRKADISDCPDVAQMLGVRSVPTLVLFQDGKVIGGLNGAQPRGRVEALLDG